MFADALPESVPTCLVVIRHIVVAADVASTIADFDPGARVLVAATLDEATALLQDPGSVTLAVIEADPRVLKASALGAALAHHGARILLVGDAAEEIAEAAGFAVLSRPFTSDLLLSALRMIFPASRPA